MIKIILTLCLITLIGCSDKSTSGVSTVETEENGSATVTITVGKVGLLAKVGEVSEINLQSLFITLSAPGVDSIKDTVAISGKGQVVIDRVYGDLIPLKTWTITARTIDAENATIHFDSSVTYVDVGESVDVSLQLEPLFSMVNALFSLIQDSVTRVELIVDDTIIVQKSFAKQSNINGTESLSFDYLSTSGTGTHAIQLNVYGDMWGFDTILYTADTTIVVEPGVDTTYDITLNWVGPTDPYPGQVNMRVTLGAIGTVTLNAIMSSTSNSSTFVDSRDSQVYREVTIGNQVWMAENLKYEPATEWMCYDQLPENCDLYGKLYTWAAVLNGSPGSTTNPSNVQGICPDGWHLPSKAEFEELNTFVDSDDGVVDNNTGKKLKTSTGWEDYLTYDHNMNPVIIPDYSTNDYGFSALASGYGINHSPTQSIDKGTLAYWWTTTGMGTTAVWSGAVRTAADALMILQVTHHQYWLSVRCIKDI
ncbi:MAG: hypothetical protein OCD76_19250 [Reichenbachiella sp.]